MSRLFSLAFAGVLVLSLAGEALAQEDLDDIMDEPISNPAPESGPEPGDDPAAGEEVELAPDDPDSFLDDGSAIGGDENPRDPRLKNEKKVVKKAPPPHTKVGYPQQVALRPNQLPEQMSQLEFRIPVAIEPLQFGGLLGASHGITREIELGLHYGTGSVNEDGDYIPGKAVMVRALYYLTDLVSAEVAIPIHLDPFALGISFGAPLKYNVTDDLALYGGSRLVTFKLKRFIPVVDSAVTNDARVIASSAGQNKIMDDGNLAFIGGAIYQWSKELALIGGLGLIANDFSLDDSSFPLLLHFVHARSSELDFGATIGFNDLDIGVDSFGVALFVAARI